MTVLQEYDAFNTTIVSKQEIENEKKFLQLLFVKI